MKSIKEKAKELSTNFRKEQGDVGYSEQLSYKLGVEAGANYVLEEIESLIENTSGESEVYHYNLYIGLQKLVKELKGE